MLLWVTLAIALMAQGPSREIQRTEIPGQSKLDQPPANDAKEPNNAAHPTPAAPPQIVSEERAPAHRKAEPKEDHGEFWSAKLTDWLLAAFTLALVVFTYRLYKATAGLWDATKGLVSFAEQQARDTKESIALSRDGLIKTERAFVFVKKFQLNAVLDPPTEKILSWNCMVNWENSGKTPTKHLRHHVSCAVTDGLLPDNFDFPDVGEAATPSLLGPNATLFSDRMALTLEQLKGIQSGIEHLYIWGWAEYDDVFPDTLRHRTEFCYKITVHGDLSNLNKVTSRWALHHTHNGADEECQQRFSDAQGRRPNFAWARQSLGLITSEARIVTGVPPEKS